MSTKKLAVTRNLRTGSYAVHVPKDASSGKFISEQVTAGRIRVSEPAKKSAKPAT